MDQHGGQRDTVALLSEETFRYQFGNSYKVKNPNGRRKTYLCYQLQLPDGATLSKDCLTNQKKKHAEIRFIDKIKALPLDKAQSCRITCYITWSPCFHCAEALVSFKKEYPRLALEIFASRLYFHWIPEYKWGLRRLCQSNVALLVMREPEFADCWEKFVDNQGEPFEPWEKLSQHSESSRRRLWRVTESYRANLVSEQGSEWIPDQNDLLGAIRNLSLDAHHPSYFEVTRDDGL